jgi:hypothetical protein
MELKKGHLSILLALMTAALSCKPSERVNNITNKSRLVGTWRLIEYSDFDTVTNKWTYP